MKESEAKTKWCPMVRMVTVNHDNRVLNSAAFNKCSREDQAGKQFEPNGSNCIASDCMMWVDDTRYYEGGDLTALREIPEDKLDRCGHCGLTNVY